jgi:lipopolysaccharide/colanic/teichoic acid biosynthesis glycosyltransferase
MWQTNGRSSVTNFDDVVEMDTRYIDEWTLWLDMKIIFKTFSEVLYHSHSY